MSLFTGIMHACFCYLMLVKMNHFLLTSCKTLIFLHLFASGGQNRFLLRSSTLLFSLRNVELPTSALHIYPVRVGAGGLSVCVCPYVCVCVPPMLSSTSKWLGVGNASYAAKCSRVSVGICLLNAGRRLMASLSIPHVRSPAEACNPLRVKICT